MYNLEDKINGAIPNRWLETFTPEQRARLDRAAEGLLKVREGH